MWRIEIHKEKIYIENSDAHRIEIMENRDTYSIEIII